MTGIIEGLNCEPDQRIPQSMRTARSSWQRLAGLVTTSIFVI